MRQLFQKLRRYIVTGLVVIAPIGVTAFVLTWLFEALDPIIGRHIPAIAGRQFPGLGLIALLVILVVVGWISQRAFGRRALHHWNRLLERVPLANRVYNASSQIVGSILERDEKLFKHCALIEFPRPGLFALVFETADAPIEVEQRMGEPAVSVFLPTSPNPTSGYLIIVPRREVDRLAMSVEDGFKLVLSAGVARPGVEASRGTP